MSESHASSTTAPARDSRIARRLLWTSLAGIVVLLLALAVMAWALSQRNRVLETRLSALFPFGGAIELEFAPYAYTPPTERKALGGSWKTGITFRDVPSPRLRWLIGRFGACAFAHVRHVKILSHRFEDNDVPYLLAVPEVRELDVSHTALTDKGVAGLTSLRHLVRLRLEGVQLAPSTLRLLANCRELRELDLTDTGVDDGTISYLEQALPGCTVNR